MLPRGSVPTAWKTFLPAEMDTVHGALGILANHYSPSCCDAPDWGGRRTMSLMVTPAAKREAVAHLRSAFEMSERRACRITGCVRMTMRYRSRRPDDQVLRERLRTLAHERRRFGYRRLHVFLKREGYA